MSNRHTRRRNKKVKPAQGTSSQVMPQSTLDLLQVGLKALQAAESNRAEAIFIRVLEDEPDNADALHLLGRVFHQRGAFEDAAAITKLAIGISDQPLFHRNLALSLMELNLVDDAVAELELYLRHVPDDCDMLNTLGNILRHEGKHDEAIARYKQALAIKPDYAGVINNLALSYYYSGHIETAQEQLERVLELDPQHVHALTNKAMILSVLGHKDEALELYQRALDIEPGFVEAENNYAELLGAEDLDNAEERLLNILPSSPDKKKTLIALASIKTQKQEWADAMDFLQQAMELDPTNPRLFTSFAMILNTLKRSEEAMPFLEGAVELDPFHADAYAQMGLVYFQRADNEKAIETCRKALDIQPNHPVALTNLGVAKMGIPDFDDAYTHLNRVATKFPGFIDGRWNYSISLLALGKLEEGWREYHIRHQTNMEAIEKRPFAYPEWDGEPLKGKRIFTWAEQGLGDEILFANTVPDLITQECEVHIECAPRLVTLFTESFPQTTVHARPYKAAEEKEVDFDYQIAMPDLCMHFRTSVDDFPSTRGYIKADPEQVDKFKKRLNEISDRPKVGISWRSGLLTKARKFSYATIEDCAPVLQLEGVDFVNLQYGDCDDELRIAKENLGVDLHGWDDLNLKDDQDGLAGLISALDLVIAPANAVVALSGALGQKTFQILPERIAWTMLGTDHMPWFPSVRLFARDNRHVDWNDTLNTLAEAIRKEFDLD